MFFADTSAVLRLYRSTPKRCHGAALPRAALAALSVEGGIKHPDVVVTMGLPPRGHA